MYLIGIPRPPCAEDSLPHRLLPRVRIVGYSERNHGFCEVIGLGSSGAILSGVVMRSQPPCLLIENPITVGIRNSTIDDTFRQACDALWWHVKLLCGWKPMTCYDNRFQRLTYSFQLKVVFVALDTEVGLKWLTLTQENEKSLWTCNLPVSPQSQCSNRSVHASSGHLRFHRSQLSGRATLQQWGPFPGMCEALPLTPHTAKAKRSQLCFSRSYRAWAVSTESSSSPASQLLGPPVCHAEVRFTAELRRCPGFSACKVTCCAYKCLGVWPYKPRNNYPRVLRHSHLLTLQILPSEHFVLGSQIFCCCCKYLFIGLSSCSFREGWAGNRAWHKRCWWNWGFCDRIQFLCHSCLLLLNGSQPGWLWGESCQLPGAAAKAQFRRHCVSRWFC